MGRYLLEVEHGAAELECLQAVHIFIHTGSHFLTNAEWGCKDGEHKAWLIVEAESKEQARGCVPPAFRAHTKVVELHRFTMEEVQDIHQQYHYLQAV